MTFFNLTSTDFIEILPFVNLRIGSVINMTRDSGSQPFGGSVSCLQIYNTALNEAQIFHKKNCSDGGGTVNAQCPAGFTPYDGTCLKARNGKKRAKTG